MGGEPQNEKSHHRRWLCLVLQVYVVHTCCMSKEKYREAAGRYRKDKFVVWIDNALKEDLDQWARELSGSLGRVPRSRLVETVLMHALKTKPNLPR